MNYYLYYLYSNNYKIKQITLLQMKLSNSLSFSSQQNRVDYQYKPESHMLSSTNLQCMNFGQQLQRSLSSSFLLMPQNNFLSVCPSLSILGDDQIQLGKRSSSINQAKIQPVTKIQQPEASQLLELGLDGLISNKKNSTKNVLRNFGNAQNQFILYNKGAQQYLKSKLQDKSQFQSWVRKLKLINFEDYQNIWSNQQNQSTKQKVFKNIYKTLCWKFYQQQSIPYIFNSRMNNDNKKTHILQIYKMLKGIGNSKQFQGFKQ